MPYTRSMPIEAGLRAQLLMLPAEERQELAEDLYESLADTGMDPAWEKAWTEEIGQRLQDVVDGTADLVDADEVHESLREELRGQRK
jgi:putative addiction module component (TIGR02574 family)